MNSIKKYIEMQLDTINRVIETTKMNLLEEIRLEQMVPASNDLLIMRDLIEKKLTLLNIIEKLDKKED